MTGLAASDPSRDRARAVPARRHEGLRAGLVGATAVWAWLFVDDLLSRVPLRTAVALGRGLLRVDRVGPDTPAWAGVVAFTLAHYALWIAVGAIAVRLARRATRASSVLFATALAFILVQFLFVGLAAILAQGRLGVLAWRDVAIGNVLGWGALCWYVAGRHAEPRDPRAPAADGRDA
jgi:hypothetical protein